MDLDLLKNISGLGVGALFGVVVYFMSLREHRDARVQLQGLVDRVLAENKTHMECYQLHLKQDLQTREENTKALTHLVTLIDRIQDKTRVSMSRQLTPFHLKTLRRLGVPDGCPWAPVTSTFGCGASEDLLTPRAIIAWVGRRSAGSTFISFQ